jgi:hypothetical protein
MVASVQAQRVRYVQIAEEWTEECLRSDTLRIDLSTDRHFKLCINQRWDLLARAYRARGDPVETAARQVDQVRAVFQDDGQTLWITFHAGRMHWTFIDPRVQPWIAGHGTGSMRRTLPWRSETGCGTPLWMSSLPPKWRKMQRPTDVVTELELGEEIVRRLNAKDPPDTARVEQLLGELRRAVLPVLASLSTSEFAQLLELIFTASGWRRQSTDAEAQMHEFALPSTNERSLVRWTPIASQAEIDEFRARFAASRYERLIFVYQTGMARSTDPRIMLLGPEQLANMTVEAGLVSWVLDKVR